ncbi:MAG: hypothetical protein ACD_76C00018G0001 [uncultured bacterium]|nr:MAG: hypothetical protein ACD_76C00018G0001 [uncultured bacterium]HBD05031.1 type I glyceraldehyde-3-phosphate dehydrogenase [Candidatus Uhrbacteria bacterium]
MRIAINGFGRIGRTTLKAGWGKPGFNVVAVNDLTDAPMLAHLLKYDTAYGRWDVPVKAGKDFLLIGGKKVLVFAEKEPANLPWKKLGVDVVIESTGRFVTKELASGHIKAGAKGVVISAPAEGPGVPTYLIGVNADKLAREKSRIINNASCTTNCIAPVAKIVSEKLGVKKAMMSTIHAYTADQNLQDGPHKDLRRARAAGANIVPTTTGAAISTTELIHSLKNKFDGLAYRVPVLSGSIADFTFVLKRKTTAKQVNNIFKKIAKSAQYRGVVEVTEEPIVSSDIIGTTASCIVDLSLTRVVDGDLLKIVAWYDNEWAYSHRLADIVLQYGKAISKK